MTFYSVAGLGSGSFLFPMTNQKYKFRIQNTIRK